MPSPVSLVATEGTAPARPFAESSTGSGILRSVVRDTIEVDRLRGIQRLQPIVLSNSFTRCSHVLCRYTLVN